MKDERKTKAQLIAELAEARQRAMALEAAETARQQLDAARQQLEAERQRLHAALQVSETRYRRLFETAQDGILLLDAATGQITDVNPFLEKLLGYSHSEIMGQYLWEIGPFKDVAESKLAFEQLQTDEYIRYEDLPLETHAGQRIEVEFVSNVYQVNGQRVIQCDVRDITARKQAEDALHELNITLEQRVADRTHRLYEANAQLSELDQLKDQFISRISHELRTPLSNIISYLDLLEHGKPEKRAQYRQVLHEQTALLRGLIESLLEVTQQSVNVAGVHVAPVDLNHLTTALITQATPRAAPHGLTLTSALTPELPFVSADRRLLAQALSKLATNALNYTPPGGTIKLATAEVTEAGAIWITFTIRDSGPGIAPDELPHIFERFYRGRAAADYKTPGAGVGLSISRDILTSLEGRLTVDSPPGEGTTFTAWLKPA